MINELFKLFMTFSRPRYRITVALPTEPEHRPHRSACAGTSAKRCLKDIAPPRVGQAPINTWKNADDCSVQKRRSGGPAKGHTRLGWPIHTVSAPFRGFLAIEHVA